MKKFATILMLFIGLGLIVSCGKKATPEDEVRNYGKYFVEKLNAGQLDSLKSSYPDISKADSIVSLQSDTIIVKESAPGQFEIVLMDGVTLTVVRADDGSISVAESKGLFVFPEDKVSLSKQTGMWDDKLSDTQLSERMKDEEFFKYIQDQIKNKTSNIITVTKLTWPKEYANDPYDFPGNYEGTQTITNHSDIPLDGSEYSFIRKEEFCYQGVDEKETKIEKGKPIPANGSIKVNSWLNRNGESVVNSIKWNLTPEQLQEKFVSFTGNEYQEYLDSKK